MKTYAGVGGVAKLAQRMYAGINGVAANALKAYIGDENGKAKLWFSSMPSVVWQKSNYYFPNYSSYSILSMCYDNGMLYACGGSHLLHSSDGKKWTGSTTNHSGNFRYICSHDGVCVAVNGSASTSASYRGIYYSTDGGVNFTRAIASDDEMYFVKYLNGRWIAGGYGAFYHSGDGINWTKVIFKNSSGSLRNADDAFYDDYRAMWIVNCYDCYYKSSNGTSWSREDGKYGYRFKNGTNVIVIYSGSNKISYSTDSGATLTESVFENDAKFSDPTFYAFSAHFVDGNWVIGSAAGLIYSDDLGATWKKCKAPEIEICNVRHSDGVWMATGKESYILYSLDGITWFNTVTLQNRYMYSLFCYNGRWIAGGEKGLIYCDAFLQEAAS